MKFEIPYGYCHCGCGGKTRLSPESNATRGWVKGEPLRFIHHHNHRKSHVDYTVDAATGCWVWQRGRDSRGYGVLVDRGRRTRAHTFMYERHVGPIPDGLELDHLCQNPSCCNPEHLEAVTHAENSRRGKHVKLTRAQVVEIRRSLSVPATMFAKRYGVHVATVREIRSGRTWVGVCGDETDQVAA